MVPTPYRLETVAASLVERLDAVRRSVTSEEPGRLRAVAEGHVAAAVAEWEGLGWGDGGTQAALLREELLETALPRLMRLMLAQNAREAAGFGFGGAYDPGRRVGFGVVALAVVALMATRLGIVAWLGWLAVPALLLLLAPDVAAWASARRYAAELAEVVTDLGRIQEQAGAYDGRAGDPVATGSGSTAAARARARSAAEEGAWPRS